jgi:hypothetical protein
MQDVAARRITLPSPSGMTLSSTAIAVASSAPNHLTEQMAGEVTSCRRCMTTTRTVLLVVEARYQVPAPVDHRCGPAPTSPPGLAVVDDDEVAPRP